MTTSEPDAADGMGPLTEVLIQIRQMRDTMEEGIATARLAAETVGNVATKSDQRARSFRRLWVALGVVLVLVTGAETTVDVVIYRHFSRTAHCFQQWATASSQRTNILSKASNTRIAALDRALDQITRHPGTPAAAESITVAAAAGDAYEQISRQNPPVPPEQTVCGTS